MAAAICALDLKYGKSKQHWRIDMVGRRLRRLLADRQVSPAGLAFVPKLIETAISLQPGNNAVAGRISLVYLELDE